MQMNSFTNHRVCDASVLQCVLLHFSVVRRALSSLHVVGSRLARSVYSFFLALSLAVTVVVAAAEVEADEGWTLGARVANLTME